MKRLLFAVLFAFAVPGAAQTKAQMQSAFPPKGTFADNLVFFAERVSRLTTAPSYNTIAEHYWREKKPQAAAK
jgi:hypothetical protein